MYGTGKRQDEQGCHYNQRFQPHVKHTKVDSEISKHKRREIENVVKVDSSEVVSAKPSRISRSVAARSDEKPCVSCVKTDALTEKMLEKNVGKEDPAASCSSQACDKGKSTCQHTPLANDHLLPELGEGSVTEELSIGCKGLAHSQSRFFINGISQVEPKSSVRMFKTNDKLIKDNLWGDYLTRGKLQKNICSRNMAKDHSDTDERSTVAEEKFALVDSRNAASSPKKGVPGFRVLKLNSREDSSSFHRSSPGSVSRSRVLKSIELFEEQYRKLSCEHKRERRDRGKATDRIDLKAAMILKKEGQWVNTVQEVGEISGVEIGDQFQYRAELAVVGLHTQFSAGIDYIKVGEKLYATCIIDSGRYQNEWRSPDVFIYIGEGGNPKITKKKAEDQRIKCGNLALITSKEANLPVRVIQCCQSLRSPNTLGMNNGSGLRYTYLGLYTVRSYNRARDGSGKWMFKFTMVRMPGQPEIWPQMPSDEIRSTVEGKHGIIAGTSLPEEKKLVNARTKMKPPHCTEEKKLVNARTKTKPPHCTCNSMLGDCSSRG